MNAKTKTNTNIMLIVFLQHPMWWGSIIVICGVLYDHNMVIMFVLKHISIQIYLQLGSMPLVWKFKILRRSWGREKNNIFAINPHSVVQSRACNKNKKFFFYKYWGRKKQHDISYISAFNVHSASFRGNSL